MVDPNKHGSLPAGCGSYNRRSILKGVAIAGAALSGFAGKAGADDDLPAIEYSPVHIAIYIGGGDDPAAFGFPNEPAIAFLDNLEDQDGGGQQILDHPDWDNPGENLLLDSREVSRVNEDRLEHILKFRQDFAIVGGPLNAVPYSLIRDDDVFKAKGDIVDFEQPADNTPPLIFLQEGPYRAVFENGIKLYEDGPQAGQIKWAYTRVDFYSRANKAYLTSAVYLAWDDGLDEDGQTSTIPSPALQNQGRRLIKTGALPFDGGKGEEEDEEEEEEEEDEEDEEE